jgi:hypothetical protein
LADARAAEEKADGNLQKAEIPAQQARTEFSAARIDLTVSQLRMKATEERFDPDQQLTDMRFRIKPLGLETTH